MSLGGESLLASLPVDHFPDRSKVLGLAVLVLEVVGMLPSINADNGLVLADDGVLVLTSQPER